MLKISDVRLLFKGQILCIKVHYQFYQLRCYLNKLFVTSIQWLQYNKTQTAYKQLTIMMISLRPPLRYS